MENIIIKSRYNEDRIFTKIKEGYTISGKFSFIRAGYTNNDRFFIDFDGGPFLCESMNLKNIHKDLKGVIEEINPLKEKYLIKIKNEISN